MVPFKDILKLSIQQKYLKLKKLKFWSDEIHFGLMK